MRKNDKDIPLKVLYIVERDLVGYKTTQMNIKLSKIFDDEYVRINNGTHLDGEISDAKLWLERYKRVIIYPHRQYDLPRGPDGRSFVRMISNKIDRIMERD